jgi:protein phosphatase
VANVGDSRAYLFRDERLEQLSVDDACAMQLVGTDGRMVERNVLTSAIGSRQDVDVHLREIDIAAGDLLLLCSDGLYGCLPSGRMAELIGATQPIAARAEALIGAARSAGAPDNLSAVLITSQQDGLTA